MILKDKQHIYMIGIGGISMSGLALILRSWDYDVRGSDIASNPQTETLEKHGIKVWIGQKEENITPDISLVVYTAAIKDDNPELAQARKLNIPCIERGEFLGELTKLFKNTIGIAGTHGKTTTTSMVASVFLEAKLNPTIQVGAYLDRIAGNYYVGGKEYFIIEACEYCDSYLNFHQKSAIVLNIDDDHLDYFKSIDNIQKSFEKYVSLLPSDGILVLNGDDERCLKLKEATKAKVVIVGTQDHALYSYRNVTFDSDGFATYDVYYKGNKEATISLHVAGMHNVLNSLCCVALCREYGISYEDIQAGLSSFYGAKRRLEYIGTFHGAKIYDDYGHHPTEIRATVNSLLKKTFHESWVVFEAHTYSRFQQHLEEFADALKPFDYIIVTDIYAARETNTLEVKEDDLVKLLDGKAIHLSKMEDIIMYLEEHVQPNDIILTLGAGNVTKIAHQLKEAN